MGYGGFWIRFLAYVVDSTIVTIAVVAITLVCGLAGGVADLAGAIASFLVALLYWPLMQASSRQATFGKALVGLKVAGPDGGQLSFLRSLARELAKFVSAIPFMIGFVLAAFTGKKQALHDFIATTTVLRVERGHVVPAIAVVVLALFAPVLLVMTFGAGLVAGLMGGMAGALMTAPEVKVVEVKPAPAKPPPPASVSAADVDRLLAPLAGMDKPGTTRAGPAVLELSTFFAGTDPKVWVRVSAPPAVARASVTVTQVSDAGGASRYDPKSRFETEFFQNVQLSEARSGTPRTEGLRSVSLVSGTTEPQVQRVEGVLKLQVPMGVKTMSFAPGDAGKGQDAGPVKLTLTSMKGPDASFTFNGPRDNLIRFHGYSAQGGVVSQESSTWSTGTMAVKYSAPVARVEAVVAAEIARREYPFTLTREVTATAPIPKVMAVSAPVVVAQAEPPKLKPVEEPAKPAAEAPPPAAEAPKPAPQVEETPRIPRAAGPSAPGPRHSDLMTAVLYRDAAGVRELLAFGRWVDKPDSRGKTPLVLAVELGETEIAELLLKAGADPGRAMSIARSQNPSMVPVLERYRRATP